MVTNPLPAVMLLAIGPVAAEASDDMEPATVVGQAYLAPAPPPVAPVAQVPEATSSPQGWMPKNGPV